MTLVSFANESEPTSVDVPALDIFSCKAGSPRFSLRKRSYDQNKMNISSYNSAFLSGLFADVAKATQSEETPDTTTAPPSEPTDIFPTDEDARLDCSLPVKRCRVSHTKSFFRCGRSYKNLTEVASPVGVANFFSHEISSSVCDPKSTDLGCSPSMERIDSLHFQLNSIDPNPSPKSVKSVIDIIDNAFPNLPATVSDSSCSRRSSIGSNKQQDLTQASDQQVSDAENTTSPKESYGWFVALDDDEDEQDFATDPYTRTASSSDLAFSAPTAPKRVSNYDAEVEWARAADTVDDVLGDFF